MKSKQYFHTFDALRFLFFLLVFLLHSSSSDNEYANLILKKGGVFFFFVLSGFLITYNLLYQKKQKGDVDLKRFFKNRGLRIYPLFYALILFAFCTPYILTYLGMSSSSEGYEPNILVSSLFLENYKMMLTGTFPDGAPLRVMWSLCVNEHFYIVWALVLCYVSPKKIPAVILSGIVLSTILCYVYDLYNIDQLDLATNFNYFAFGAIPAYLLIEKPILFKKVESIPLSLKYILAFLIFLVPKSIFGVMSPLFLGFGFMVLISLTLCGNNAIEIKESYWISRLGKYTYGMYLYHTIFILLIGKVLMKMAGQVHWSVSSALALACTVIASIASFHLFEKPFLKLKKSRNLPKNEGVSSVV